MIKRINFKIFLGILGNIERILSLNTQNENLEEVEE